MKIDFFGNPSDSPPNFEKPKWLDGTNMDVVNCAKGNAEGENINYFYCKWISYYKKPVNTDGTIGNEIRLRIDLVVNQNDKTEAGYKIISSICKKSDI